LTPPTSQPQRLFSIACRHPIETWSPSQPTKLYLFAAATLGAVRGKKLGEIVALGEARMRVLAQGGFVEVSRVRLDDGAKVRTLLGVRPPAPAADRDKARDNGGPPPSN
jgi:hypothetical protein